VTTDYLDGGELAKFYPLDVMETGHDILFPWVSRMIMLGCTVPTKCRLNMFICMALVLDEHGQKIE
jgi:valyl-tRNA synthetase